MPTLSWIQETATDRFWETGFDSPLAEDIFTCKFCKQTFGSIAERDRHEISHPLHNPAIYFGGKEISSELHSITTQTKHDDVVLSNIDFISINGVALEHLNDFYEKLTERSIAYLDVSYGNSNLVRRLKINICVADPDELLAVEHAFIKHFSIASISDSNIGLFVDEVGDLPTVIHYTDGLVRYLQGVMIKDNRSSMSSFTDFMKRFNQATQSLKQYETGLSRAIRSVVNFNRNDFKSIEVSGIPELDTTIDFFRGGEMSKSKTSDTTYPLPVDSATEFIFTELLPSYARGSLRELEDKIETIHPSLLSLQDKLKLKFVIWRKAVESGDIDSAKNYSRVLKHDEAFAAILEKNNE